MNQLQVLKKLIPIYTEAINRIADGENTFDVLTDTITMNGICYCAILKLKINIYNTNWALRISYTTPPYNYNYTKNITNFVIECLSYRLTIMQLMVMDLTNKKGIVNYCENIYNSKK